MNVRPLHDRIIVQRVEEGEQHIGGIVIPDTAKEKPQQGTVIAAGNGRSLALEEQLLPVRVRCFSVPQPMPGRDFVRATSRRARRRSSLLRGEEMTA